MKLDREKVKQNEQKDGKSSVKTMTEKEKQEIRDIVSAYNNGDNDLKAWAIEEMVRRTNGFIGTIINKHFEEFKNEYYGDLHAEGVVAIIENMGGLDIDKGTITTYFTRILIHAMSEFLHSETSRSTPYYANIMRKIKEAQKYYESAAYYSNCYRYLSSNRIIRKKGRRWFKTYSSSRCLLLWRRRRT